nr:MAG TPA: hypothetical protein [Caudoviricetes sp.]
MRSGENGRFDSYKALASNTTKGLRVRSYSAVMTFAQARKPSSIEYNAGNRLE